MMLSERLALRTSPTFNADGRYFIRKNEYGNIEWIAHAFWLRLVRYRKSESELYAPWPIVGECHSSHVEGHRCEQCRPTHEHQWQSWDAAPVGVISGPGTPIRCVVCGARKCDQGDCSRRRHDHGHLRLYPVKNRG